MITSAAAVKIRVQPEKVFKFLLDPEKLKSTIPAYMNINISKGDFIGPGVQMQWVLQKKDGSHVKWTEEYVGYKENELLQWKTTQGPFWKGEYRLHQIDEGTFLTMVESTDYFESSKQHEEILKAQLEKTKELLEK